MVDEGRTALKHKGFPESYIPQALFEPIDLKILLERFALSEIMDIPLV
jgi:hypothetical protein